MTKNALVKFKANLFLYKYGEGGRKTPIANGFRCDLTYSVDEIRFAAFEFDAELLSPGDRSDIVCHMLLHSNKEIDNVLEKAELEIIEGPNTIGSVLLTEVIDRELVVWKDN